MLTFSIARLSYEADTSLNIATQQSNWLHKRDDVFAVFDTFRTPSEVLRVVQGTQVLYDIPIQKLVDRGKEITNSLARRGAQVLSDQLPIFAMVKCPLIGLRWSLPDECKIRRIQLRFAADQDFDTAIAHLSQLGLWITPGSSSTSSRPSAVPESGGPSCPPSQLSELTGRPYTAMPVSTSPLHAYTSEAANARPVSAAAPNAGPIVPPYYFQRPTSATSTVLSMVDSNRSGVAAQSALTSITDVPPRRQLPFSRPESPQSRGSDVVRPTSRPSSVMGPPPLPAQGARRPSSRADSELPSLPKPTIINSIHEGPQTAACYSEQKFSREGFETPRPTSAILGGKENWPPRRSLTPMRPATSDGMRQRSLLRSTNNAAETENFSDQPDTLPTPPASDAAYHSVNSEYNMDTANAASDLAAYAMQSNEGRMTVLNNFIFQHLEDDNFLALVEDMDACWARIAPGLG